jgi:hypothetical protein
LHQILAFKSTGYFSSSNKTTWFRFPLAYSFLSHTFFPVATNKGEVREKANRLSLAIESLGQIVCFAQYWDIQEISGTKSIDSSETCMY